MSASDYICDLEKHNYSWRKRKYSFFFCYDGILSSKKTLTVVEKNTFQQALKKSINEHKQYFWNGKNILFSCPLALEITISINNRSYNISTAPKLYIDLCKGFLFQDDKQIKYLNVRFFNKQNITIYKEKSDNKISIHFNYYKLTRLCQDMKKAMELTYREYNIVDIYKEKLEFTQYENEEYFLKGIDLKKARQRRILNRINYNLTYSMALEFLAQNRGFFKNVRFFTFIKKLPSFHPIKTKVAQNIRILTKYLHSILALDLFKQKNNVEIKITAFYQPIGRLHRKDLDNVMIYISELAKQKISNNIISYEIIWLPVNYLNNKKHRVYCGINSNIFKVYNSKGLISQTWEALDKYYDS